MQRSKLQMLGIALLTCFVGLAACNSGNHAVDDAGTDNDTGQMADAGDTGGDVGGDTGGDTGEMDATSDAADTGPTRSECLGGEPLNIFCTGDVAPECQQYCEDVDAGTPDGGQSDGGGSDSGDTGS